MKIGLLSGRARATDRFRKSLGLSAKVDPISTILDNEAAIDSLSVLLTEAIETKQTKDGRIDMRDVARHVLAEMKRNMT